MSTWEPITRANSLLEGREPGTDDWAKIAWRTASASHGQRGILLVAVGRHARQLTARAASDGHGQIFPVAVPDFYGTARITPHGWIWLVGTRNAEEEATR